MRQLLATLRHRPAPLVGIFVALALAVGAIITSADGKPVTTPAFLMLMIERTPIGATVRLKGNFNTAPFTTNAKVVPFPADWAPIYLQVQEGPVQLFL